MSQPEKPLLPTVKPDRPRPINTRLAVALAHALASVPARYITTAHLPKYHEVMTEEVANVPPRKVRRALKASTKRAIRKAKR